jgi:hypothetical protein
MSADRLAGPPHPVDPKARLKRTDDASQGNSGHSDGLFDVLGVHPASRVVRALRLGQGGQAMGAPEIHERGGIAVPILERWQQQTVRGGIDRGVPHLGTVGLGICHLPTNPEVKSRIRGRIRRGSMEFPARCETRARQRPCEATGAHASRLAIASSRRHTLCDPAFLPVPVEFDGRLPTEARWNSRRGVKRELDNRSLRTPARRLKGRSPAILTAPLASLNRFLARSQAAAHLPDRAVPRPGLLFVKGPNNSSRAGEGSRCDYEAGKDPGT